MQTTTLLILTFAGLTGAAVAAASWGAVSAVTAGGEDRRVRQRLKPELLGPAGGGRRLSKKAGGWLTRLGERIAAPFMEKSGSGGAVDRLRRDLIAAGVYAPNAYKLVVGARVTLLVVGLVVGYAASAATGYDWLMTLPVCGLVGYMLPKMWVSRRIRQNHGMLERGLPDGLDLLVVCVEAGLTIDAAMQRVSEELALAHPALARELSICHMETRIGVPRAQALKNLGQRTAFAPLQAVTAMLVQADRFGTSIATALRVQAESMRVARQHRAEESAAKATVKLSFPLVLFIFPATFIVLAGPMVINFMVNGFFGGD